MISDLAVNAVKIKCGFPHASMTGNYECAYALGILTACGNLSVVEDYPSMSELRSHILSSLTDFSPEDDRIKRLLEMVSDYEATKDIDDQMKELYRMGIAHKRV